MILKKSPIIHTDRLVLKPYEDSDKDRMIEILRNEEIKKTFMIPDLDTMEQAEKMFNKLKEFSYSDEHFEYGIYREGELIGFMNDVEMDDDSIEIGYVIHPDYKGYGYATEAFKTGIEELFRMGYSCIKAGYFEENPASGRVMEKCGLKQVDKIDEIEYHGKMHKCLNCEIRR